MNILNSFINNLCGNFNNDDQISLEIRENKLIHPKAMHINGICNYKIFNVPTNFDGFFVLEESYYEIGNLKNYLPHLFLFTLNTDGNIVLTSYDIPNNIKKEDFRNDNLNLKMNFNDLKVSEKFTPMTYIYKNGEFKGESISHFNSATTFILKETVKDNILEVSEVFKKDGKITFGFESPIIYKKISK